MPNELGSMWAYFHLFHDRTFLLKNRNIFVYTLSHMKEVSYCDQYVTSIYPPLFMTVKGHIWTVGLIVLDVKYEEIVITPQEVIEEIGTLLRCRCEC